MIDKINNNQPLNGASAMFPNINKSSINKDLDVSINNDYSALIEEAMKSPQNESEIIAQARESIRSGELELPQNIMNAAENMLTFGI